MTTTPVKISPIIVGTMRLGAWGAQFSTADYERFIDACLDLGINDFDHADIYGHYTTESEFGAVLKKRPDLRSKVQLTTKCGIRLVSENRPAHRIKSYDSSKEHIVASVEESLKALSVEQIDIFLLHRPDYLMHPHEIATAFEQLKKAGKVRAFGVSNFTASQFDLLHSFTPLVTNQVEASILHLDAFGDGTLDQCLKHGVVPTAWSPFGGGALFSEEVTPRVERIREVANGLAEKYSASLDQVLLAFLHQHPAGIIPVVGTTKVERVEAALKSLTVKMTREEWYDLWQASTGEEVA